MAAGLTRKPSLGATCPALSATVADSGRITAGRVENIVNPQADSISIEIKAIVAQSFVVIVRGLYLSLWSVGNPCLQYRHA